jgi:hypothetical protein
LILLLLTATPVFAQYTTATITARDEPDATGRVHVVVTFTGTDVPPVRRSFFPDDVVGLRSGTAATILELNQKSMAAKALIVGATVPAPITPPPPPPPPSPDPAVVARDRCLNLFAYWRNITKPAIDDGFLNPLSTEAVNFKSLISKSCTNAIFTTP